MKQTLIIVLVLLLTGIGLAFAFEGELIINTVNNFSARNWLEVLFAAIVAGFLIVDLGWLNRKAHRISIRSAILQTLFWVGIALGYGILIYLYISPDTAAEFAAAFVTEKMLSADNLMVIMVLLAFLNIDAKYHHRVLFWGILGAVVFRGLFIGIGGALVANFHWILYIFGAVLVFTGIKLLVADEKDQDFSKSWIYRFLNRYFRTTDEHHGHFFKKIDGKNFITTLFIAVVMVETTDIIFAVDSIPACFAISKDPFVVYTSNIFAVMGLRALFFFVEGVLEKFHHLGKGIPIVLVFIGGKMLVDYFGLHISSFVSLGVIIGILTVSIIASLIFPKKEEVEETETSDNVTEV